MDTLLVFPIPIYMYSEYSIHFLLMLQYLYFTCIIVFFWQTYPLLYIDAVWKPAIHIKIFKYVVYICYTYVIY